MPNLITVGQLIDRSFEHYRLRFVELVSISAWMLVPMVVSVVSLALYPSYTTLISERALSNMETAGVILWTVNALIVTPITGVWMLIALLRRIQDQLNGKRPALSVLRRTSWKLFWPMVFVNLLILLILIGAAAFAAPGALLLVLPWRQAAAFGGLLLTVGLIVGTALGVRWLIFFAYGPLALALEGLRGRAALARAHTLVSGRFWSALALMALPKVVFALVVFVVEWLLLTLTSTLVASAAGLNMDLAVRLNGILETIVISAGIVLVNPIIFTADVLLYRSLKETKKSEV
jgi:hypothetical protein